MAYYAREAWTSLTGRPSAEASEQPQLGHIPLLPNEILIDDDHATLVLVFPRSTEDGGVVDADEMVEYPLEEAHKIFVRPQNNDTLHKWGDNFAPFHDGPVTMREYQKVCRKVLLDIILQSGLRVESFPSIDNDESFLKVCLERDSDVISQLAQRFQYRMPFKEKAYNAMEAQGMYEGGKPMYNADNYAVPAFTEFEYETAEALQPFRDVDEVRLIERCLDEWVDTAELLSQKIISKIFPGAKHEMVLRLHGEWGSLYRVWKMPGYKHMDDIRDYFGEQIAFFFFWFAFYVNMLAPLGFLGLICFICSFESLGISLAVRREIQIIFAFVLVAWASIYNELFKNRDSRCKQRWGMKDFDTLAVERPQYDPDMEGTWSLWCRQHLANVAVVTCCALFVVAITIVELWKKSMLEVGNKDIAKYGALTTVVLIKVTSFGWGMVAPHLANAQNHRTQMRWNDALTWILTSVKLFVALFPFINLTFLKKYTSPTCDTSLQDVAWKLYGQSGWPHGIAAPLSATANGTTAGDFGWLNGFHYKTKGGRECIYGCYPVKCHLPEGGAANCVTNCVEALEQELLAVYATHVVSTVVFLLIPILLTKWSVHQEIVKIESEGSVTDDTGSEEADTPRAKHYSFMQYQAKCYDQAKYEYKSWGGSQVEDFLELAVGFALLTCFGIIVPVMAMIAFVAHVVEYRLLAYRMTNVTCRPMPSGAEGIGSWQTIFEGISFLAVAINVGIAVFVLRPMTAWGPAHQLGAFIVLEHAMLFLKVVLAGAIPDEPPDVQRIEDFNARFKAKFVHRGELLVPKLCDAAHIDIELESSS